jgi:gliding motility-associated-like protein
MRKIYSLLLLSFGIFVSKTDAQIIIKNGRVDTCGGTFYDTGGKDNNFRGGETFVYTIYSTDPLKSHISLGFDLLDIRSDDELCFFDGTDVNAPLIACAADFRATQNAIIQTTNGNRTGAMTVRWRSSTFGRLFGLNLQYKGWAANIICIPACQSIKAAITSTLPLIVPADTGYINACPNTTRINFKAQGIYPQNGNKYVQNDTINKFEWNFGDGTPIAYGTDVTHIFEKSGGYNVKLVITDTLGCQNTNYIKQRVRVAPKPTFNISNLPSQVCAGTEINLKAKSDGIDASYQVSVGRNEGTFNLGGVRSGRLFIPDNPTQEYRTAIRFSDFAPGQTLTNINDLTSIFVNMEHSWARDLEIKIVCPNLQSAILHKYDVGTRNTNEIHIGQPNDVDGFGAQINDSTYNQPGRGASYEWVPTGATSTWRSFSNRTGVVKLPAGRYNAEDNLTKLIGCPLNGDWTLVVKDQFEMDNGWIFAWGINFRNTLYPGLESFRTNIVEHGWTKNPYYTTTYTGDDMTIKPKNAGSANIIYRVKDDFNCVFDTSINIKVLPPTAAACLTCQIDTFFSKMRDTLICANNAGVLLNMTPIKNPNRSITFDAFPNAEIDALIAPPLSPFTSILNINSVYPNTLTNVTNQLDSVCFDIGTYVSSDMVVELQSPSGQKITLFNERGGIGQTMRNICFSPKATRSIATATPPYSGLYLPEGGVATWNTLNGATINGDWQLLVSDSRGTNKDTINRWSLTFNNQNGFKYNWTPAATLSCTTCPNPTATPSVSTTYRVNITDSLNCTYTDTIRINVIDSIPAPMASVQNINFTFIIFDWLPVTGASGYQVSINGGPWITPSGALSHNVRGLKIGDVVNFRVRAISNAACGARIATLTQATRPCVATVGNGFNRRVEQDSILCHGSPNPRINFAFANGIAPITYIIDTLVQPSNPIFIDNIYAGKHKAIMIDSTGCRDSIEFYVYQPDSVKLALTPSVVKCFGDDNGRITATPTGGVGNYTYRLTTFFLEDWRNTNVFDSLQAGVHTVEMEDGNGCAVSAMTEILSPPQFIVDFSKNDARCFGTNTGSATAAARGGTQPYTWAWTNGKTTETIDTLAAGDYTVTVTDKNGCFFEQLITIDQNADIVLTTTADSAKCFDEANGKASVTATGGFGTFVYRWSNNQVGQDNINIKAGRYVVTATDGFGCTDTAVVSVMQPDSLRFDSLVTVKTLCPNEATGSATAYVRGGIAPYTYEWNPVAQRTNRASNLAVGRYSIIVKDAKGCVLDEEVNISSNSAVKIDNLAIVPLKCNGDANGQIAVTASGGVGNFTYRWSTTPAQTAATALNLRTGRYAVTITDGNNCSVSKDTLLTEPAKLDATILVYTDVKCKGEANGTATPSVLGGTTFGAGLKYRYQWNDPLQQTEAVATGLNAGNYILSITDANGCIDTANVRISEPASAVTIRAQQVKLACFKQNTGEATVIAVGGNGNYSYRWSNLQSNATAFNLTSQLHYVTVTDIKGCSTIDSVFIQTYDSMQVRLTPVNPACAGDNNGTINVASVIGGGGDGVLTKYLYRWNTAPAQTTQQSVNLAGNKLYVVTVTDDKGCQSTINQYIESPLPIKVSVVTKDPLCYGVSAGEASISVVGQKSPFRYQWDTNAASQTSATIQGLAAGSYKVRILDTSNCKVDTTIIIGQPERLRIDKQQITNTKCNEEATGKIDITVAGGLPAYTYLWSNSVTAPSISNVKAGKYDVIITDKNGCQLLESFTVKTPNGLDGDVTVINSKCFGDANGSITIDAFGGTQPYLYSLGGKTYNGINQIVGVRAGKYEVYIKDANNCTWFDQVEIMQPPKFTIEAINDVTLNLGDSIMLSADVRNNQGNVQISWLAPYDKTLSCIKCPTPMSKPMYTITYAVLGVDSAGCKALDSVKVNIVKPRFVTVPTAFTPNEDQINDRLYVRGKTGTKVLVFRVYDRWGELLFETQNANVNDPDAGWDGKFKGQPMTSGMYVWYIDAEYIDGAKEILKGNTTLIR